MGDSTKFAMWGLSCRVFMYIKEGAQTIIERERFKKKKFRLYRVLVAVDIQARVERSSRASRKAANERSGKKERALN